MMLRNSIGLFLMLIYGYMHSQQNTILIIADDIGTDYLGMYENAKDTVKIPNIRNLLSRGIRFQNFYTTPYCSPTRASLLTGRFPFRHGVGTVIGGNNSAQLDTSEISLARLLNRFAPASYHTAHIGKWHMNVQTPQTLEYPRQHFGYDLYSGNFQGAINSYTNWTKITNGTSKSITTYATTETINDAIEYIDTISSEKPFFMWLAFNAPHSPYHKPPDSLHTQTGLTGTTPHINQNPKLYFKAMAEAMDSEIGRLLNYLTRKQILENTNIVFLGDNGNASNTAQDPLTSNKLKGTLYEGGIHEPLIISGPVVKNPNRISSALVSITDLFSTILEMNGFNTWPEYIPANRPIDSKSILPILKNIDTAIRKWTYTELFSPTPNSSDGKTIRNDTFKLIRFENGKEEFYNLKTDALEQNNLLLQNLKSTERLNYISLCNELKNLMGANTCSQTVPIKNLSALGIKIYPSPFSSQFIIDSKVSFNFYCTNSLGRMIHQGHSLGNITILTTDWPPSIYFLTVTTKHGMATIKMIHQ